MLRIAVCDDDPIYINSTLKPLFSEALKAAELPAEIHFFVDGVSLLGEFRAHNGYDIVFLDIDMPDVNGIALAEELRKLDARFYLAFLTAYPDEAINTIPYSVKAFIPKNYSRGNILSTLAKLFKDYSAAWEEHTVFEIIKDGE
ncbi:MAG: response regulator, partial [Ruminococcaceae bacterium]|nr:response regulator [Oscillospiraceae bacterium]